MLKTKDIKKYKNKFKNDGYFIIQNFLNKVEISNIIKEVKKSKNTDIYKDDNNIIRRIERIYNKGKYLKEIHNQFVNLIKSILNLKVLIFKDKFNFKPPNGDGFDAHYY